MQRQGDVRIEQHDGRRRERRHSVLDSVRHGDSSVLVLQVEAARARWVQAVVFEAALDFFELLH